MHSFKFASEWLAYGAMVNNSVIRRTGCLERGWIDDPGGRGSSCCVTDIPDSGPNHRTVIRTIPDRIPDRLVIGL